jgi:uncharacterized protein (DUF2252 family)
MSFSDAKMGPDDHRTTRDDGEATMGDEHILPKGTNGAAIQRLLAASTGEGIGHGRLRDLLEQELVPQEHIAREDALAFGKSLRKQVPRSSHAEWQVDESRERAMRLLRDQERERVQGLLPIRHQRMAESAFAFYRGAAIIMADDLARTPTTDIRVQACGDAHLANFGIFASAERRLVFDINDFDETLPAPWEWDVKRLMASVEICGRHLGLGPEERLRALHGTASGYHDAMRRFSGMGNLEAWYAHLDIEEVLREHEADLRKAERSELRATVRKAATKTSTRAVERFTETVDGKLRIVSDPPLLVPLRDLSSVGISQETIVRMLGRMLARYRLTLPRERRALIDQYEPEDMARKVVGVGSVGMRTWIVVMMGAGPDDPLVLQFKEATSSVLEPYAGASPYREHGRRVVEGQHAMQASGDVLLGWVRLPDDTGVPRDYYVRQLWDAKGSVDLEQMSAHELAHFGALCAWTLAHAHARTGNRHAIAGYLGKGSGFENALCEFAQAYADQNEADWRLFLESFDDAAPQGA